MDATITLPVFCRWKVVYKVYLIIIHTDSFVNEKRWGMISMDWISEGMSHKLRQWTQLSTN